MRVTLFDYGAGNIHSLAKALVQAGAGAEVVVQADPVAALDTDVLVLPGVGAFGAAAARLAPGLAQMRQAILDGMPCLGICLGMQLFFDGSEEGPGAGLGVFSGQVTRLRTRSLPHIGWNRLEDVSDPVLSRSGLVDVYYAHSFACRLALSEPGATSWTQHEDERFIASVRRDKLWGVQFHPEKSSSAGLRFLASFLEEVRA